MPEIVPLPPLFLERMSRYLGEEFPAFLDSYGRFPLQGLRINTLKVSLEEFKRISGFELGREIPWCSSAFLLENEEKLGKHPFHLAGLYYLQDPSAMSAATLLDPQPGEFVLDLAAAPGGKTTQLASLMKGQGLLLANEIKTKRLNHLVANVERWAAGNVVVTNETPERLADHFGAAFDRVLVDAPCSGEGMFRKDMGARLDWSEEMVAGCAVRQTNILRVAAHLVKPGGHLVYSTCTFAPEEDEGVISRFLDEHRDFEVETLPRFPGFMSGQPGWLQEGMERESPKPGLETLTGAVRLFPHRLDGEGHFVCLLSRKNNMAEDRSFPRHPSRISRSDLMMFETFRDQNLGMEFPVDRLQLQGDRLFFVPESSLDLGGLRTTLPGIWIGNIKKDRFEPAHPLALYLRKDQFNQVVDLPVKSRELAAYLRGESLQEDGASGWVLIAAEGWPIGWGKRVNGVVKNHFPHGWMQ